MHLSTSQYGFIIDPMVPFTDASGTTIANGYVRVFLAGTTTPVITYANFDGTANQETIQLDNSGRTATKVIGSKGQTFKVCVYDAEHSQETPILTVDKVSPIGASVNATGATIVTGLDSVTVQEENFIKATVEGTSVELSLDPTEVTSEVRTISAAETAAPDVVVPLLDKTGEGDSKKISLANLFKFALDWISRLAKTITSFASGDFIAVSNQTDGTRKMSKDTLLTLTAQNALAGNVAPAFDPTRTSDNPYKAGESVTYEGKTYTFKVDHYGAWASADVVESDVSGSISKSAGFAKNLIKNNNFVDSDGWTANYCTKTISNNECVLSSPTSINSRLNYNKNLITTFVSGHVYLFAVKIENDVASKLTSVALYIGDGLIPSSPLHSADGSRYLYATKTITSLNEIGVYFNRGGALTTGDSVTISDVIFIDLTDIYGAGNEPDAELAFGALGVSGSVSQYYLPKESYLAIKNKSVVVVGDSSSPANECDVICDGVNDQQKINALIALGNVKKIVFYKGANFAISAPIVAKSGLVIEGNCASLVMDDVVTQNLTSYEGNKVYLKMDASNTKFVPGMLLQVKEGDNWFCRYLTSINYTAGTFYLDDSRGNTPSSGYTTAAEVSNVSSAIVCDNVSDVSIRDLIIDLNYDNNPQSKNTFDAQNGVHVYESSGVVVENCEIKNGGRHGVLFSSSYNCVLRHCKVHDWYEHAVDLAWHVDIVGNDYDIQNHIVENCELSNASNYGVQMHRGCGCHVVNNYIHGNGLGGVQSNRGHSNVISGNVIKGNSGNGILLISCANNVVSDNVIDTTSRYGISVEGNNGFSKNGLVISANLIKETGFPCISIEDFVNAVIVGNMLFGAVVCKAGAAHNVFRSNTFDSSTALSHTSYYENGASVGANVFVGNTLIGCNAPTKTNVDTIIDDNIFFDNP